MFVQYSFVEKHRYPGFKEDPIHLGPTSIVVLGILAMLVTSAAYIVL
jgi:hypothetical protein